MTALAAGTIDMHKYGADLAAVMFLSVAALLAIALIAACIDAMRGRS